MEIVQSILTNNPCYKAGETMEVQGLMLHSVGCRQPSAEEFIKQWNAPTVKRCVHAFIDGNTGTVYQTLPWNYKGWHCGGGGNKTHIGVEMCEPASIEYSKGAEFNCLDRDDAFAVVKRTYDAAVELFAFLCHEYHLNPLMEGVVISHREGHARGIASGHVDPSHLWDGLKSGYTMDGFRHDVDLAMHRVQRPVQPGDIVKLMPDAVYDTGKEIPQWVMNSQWFVKSVEGNRAVLGKNVENTNEINSPVNVNSLIVLVPADADDPENPEPKFEEMNISEEGVKFIMRFEGCRLEAYQCAGKTWTIGYGHTRGVQPGDTLPSKEAARQMLCEDLKEYVGYVNTYRKTKLIDFPLNQNQFDALTSFCYNRGSGSLKELVAGRTQSQIADAMESFIIANNQVNEGLKRRRKEEKALFLSC